MPRLRHVDLVVGNRDGKRVEQDETILIIYEGNEKNKTAYITGDMVE